MSAKRQGGFVALAPLFLLFVVVIMVMNWEKAFFASMPEAAEAYMSDEFIRVRKFDPPHYPKIPMLSAERDVIGILTNRILALKNSSCGRTRNQGGIPQEIISVFSFIGRTHWQFSMPPEHNAMAVNYVSWSVPDIINIQLTTDRHRWIKEFELGRTGGLNE